MAGASMQPLWRAAASQPFDWRLWEGEMVVYVLATGVTHELSASASAVLAALLHQPGEAFTEARLLDGLAPLLATGDAGDELCADELAAELDTLRELLGHMASMGLVERHTVQMAS